MINETEQMLNTIINYLPFIIILLEIPIIIWGVIRLFTARKELIEQYRRDRANLKQEIRQITGEK